MNFFLTRLVCAVFVAGFISGCGGCQPGTPPAEDEGGAGAKKAQAPASGSNSAPLSGGAEAPTRSAGGGALPTARGLPTMNVGQAPAGGGMQGQQGAPGEEPPAAEDEDETEDADCSVIADADPDYGEPPLTVHFSVDYECSEGSATVGWDFGDHTGGSSEENPTHTYRAAGEYTAVVTITTSDGAKATDEIDITVENEDGSPPDVEPDNP